MAKHPSFDETKLLFEQAAGSYMDARDLRGVFHAEERCLTLLEGKVRASGDPFAIHPLSVALVLTAQNMDRASLEAALLLAPLEKDLITLEDIAADGELSPKTATLLEGVVSISRHSYRRGKVAKAESFRKLILMLAKDIRVILIKLGDRLASMRTLQYLDEDTRREIAQETLDIYAPLANRLGIYRVKSELEDLAFRFLYKEEYLELKALVAQKKSEREQFIADFLTSLEDLLKQNNIHGYISGRPKHFWSIKKKMEKRGVDFHDLYDITAFRVIVDTIPDCYQMLGLVHAKWRPIPGQFDDYIAMPKPNGYQSLHTAVVGASGERVEIQIRTSHMHEIAENGVAAHWRYKEADKGGIQENNIKRFGWLHDALASGVKGGFDEHVLDSLRTDLFEDEVFIFTPAGDVRELPKGATPLDFAFAVHTQLGTTCVGAKVNGRMVPLDHHLSNGDTVAVITNKNARPSKDWLDMVISERARTKIKHALREERRQQERRLGRELFEKILKDHGVKVAKALRDEAKISRMLEALKMRSLEELYLTIGRGDLEPPAVLTHLAPEALAPDQDMKARRFEEALTKPLQADRAQKSTGGILVGGLDGLLVRYAQCCNPVVGDDIVGYITRGRGVTIHRRDCERVPKGERERIIDVSWAVNPGDTMPVRLRITADDRQGLLASIGDTFKKYGLNVVSVSARSSDNVATMIFTVQVHTVEDLRRVSDALKKKRGVWEIERIADAIER